mgnify:CR=1 FL=1
MPSKKKYSITLLEVLIGLVLAGIILSFLFSLLRQTLEKKQEISQLKQTIFSREMMRLRMNQIINSLTKNESGIYVDSYEDRPSLFFYYENKDKDVNFCGMIHSMLYVNEHKQLVLNTFSKQDNKRDEVLLENIHAFTFELFDQTKATWESEWLKTKTQLPEMVRLHLKIDQDAYDLVLFVTEPKNPIIYGVKL